MASSISGNCGLAGATVQYIGAWSGTNSTHGVVTADGSGNYTITGLPAGTFTITPYTIFQTFTPGAVNQVVDGSANVTGLNFTAAATVGVWQQLGVVISPNVGADYHSGSGTSGTEEPTVLYEANPQLISANADGKVFKNWFAGGVNVYYAESNDGEIWTRQATALLTNVGNPRVFKYNGTYYLTGAAPLGGTQIDLYTCVDGTGVNFTLAHSAIITTGSAGQWDSTAVWDMSIVEVDGGGLWHAVYCGTGALPAQYNTGYATSPDGVTWTKYNSNIAPVLLNCFNVNIHKVGSVYYAFGQMAVFLGNGSQPYGIPTQMAMSTSTDYINWTAPQPIHQRVLWEQGYNEASDGQAGTDPVIVEANGKTYCYYSETRTGTTGTGFQLGGAVYNGTLSSLVALSSQGAITPNAGLRQISSGGSSSSANSISAAAINIPTGDLIIVAARPGNYGVTCTGITDTAGNDANYTKINGVSVTSQLGELSLWYCPNATGNAANVVTAHFSASQGYNAIFVWDVFGALSNPLDANQVSNAGSAIVSSVTSPSFNIGANEFLAIVATTQTVNTHLAVDKGVYGGTFPLGSGLLYSGAAHQVFSSAQTGITRTMSQASTSYMTLALASFKLVNLFVSTIFGNAGVAGAMISYSGTASGSVIADGSGNYSILNLANGSYTITPSKTGYTFSPVNSAQTVNGADITGVNFTATQLQVATPTFSPVAGTYSSAQSVMISSTDFGLGGFAMYYTTDGSTPTAGSTLYTGAITVSASETLKVLAVATGYLDSAIASAVYIIAGSGGSGLNFDFRFRF